MHVISLSIDSVSVFSFASKVVFLYDYPLFPIVTSEGTFLGKILLAINFSILSFNCRLSWVVTLGYHSCYFKRKY